MKSTEIGRETKVYKSLWSGGNESRSSDHLQDLYFPIYTLYIIVSRSRNRLKLVITLTRAV